MIDIGNPAADAIDSIASDLHSRIMAETERLLKEQLKKLGVAEDSLLDEVTNHCLRIDHADDPTKLATYFYREQPILGVRVGENMMSIEFDVPNFDKGALESQQKGEDQNVV